MARSLAASVKFTTSVPFTQYQLAMTTPSASGFLPSSFPQKARSLAGIVATVSSENAVGEIMLPDWYSASSGFTQHPNRRFLQVAVVVRGLLRTELNRAGGGIAVCRVSFGQGIDFGGIAVPGKVVGKMQPANHMSCVAALQLSTTLPFQSVTVKVAPGKAKVSSEPEIKARLSISTVVCLSE